MNIKSAYEDLRKDCIINPYTPKPHGYCQVKIKGTNYLHHRLAYAAHIGVSIDSIDNIMVLHKCDNRRCINPAHLFPGNNALNMQDMVAKGRNKPALGESHKLAKLTEAHVKEIRARGKETHRLLGAEFGISAEHVGRIVARKAWKHI